ncbi:MAG: FAD-dependent oxidoreductase [Candidatus Nealsonbacteria bacterium]|nr:FAD-dependent oxidoreductase [Candidatus Nealsonbacteria bacterium]
MKILPVAIALCAVVLTTAAFAAENLQTVLLEAEAFEKPGGWMVDQQFIDQMGSPILLAHGMGRPVEDAVTTATLPAGVYRVMVRTRDWVAPWKGPGAPGRFQLIVDGKPLQTTFGTQGAKWHWQDGGTIEVAGGKTNVALHDLTGFDGRCDAILFTTDKNFTPPDDGPALAALRKKLLGLSDQPKDAGKFDLVVIGGGMAGTCAAVSAARLGLDVALIQNRPVLGGNNSSEVRVHLGGKIHQKPFPAIGGVVNELDSGGHGNAQPAEQYDDQKKLDVARAEKTLHLFLNTHACKVEKEGDRITAVVARNIRTSKELRFTAPLFADCTGDGTIGHLAGADYRYGRENRDETGEEMAVEKADRQTMGTSVMWYSVETDEPATFPDCPWAIQFNEKNYQQATAGNWNWETGFRVDQIDQFEFVRDHGLRAVYGNWAYQKNHAPDKQRYANRKLGWVAYVGGKRESRRLLGDVILKQQDVDGQRAFPDACVTCTWSIDLHLPIQSDQFPGEEFRSRAIFHKTKPYAIPYRCFYSRNVDNLFMAGRNISVTHVALGTVRVMRTCGMMGEVVGMAAEVCKRYDAKPRDVYTNYLDDLKKHLTEGVGKLPMPQPPAPPKPPEWLKTAGPNLARSAAVSVSGNYTKANYPVAHINDGRVSYTDNALRWVSDETLPGRVDLTWQRPQTIGAVRIVTGQGGGGKGPITPITDFVLQYHDGTEFKEIPGTRVTGNNSGDWHAKFEPVTTGKVRLSVTRTPGNLTRIWEIELYGGAGSEE